MLIVLHVTVSAGEGESDSSEGHKDAEKAKEDSARRKDSLDDLELQVSYLAKSLYIKMFSLVMVFPRTIILILILQQGKTWKGEMIKRREECNTYLTHVCRHRWNRDCPVK